MPYDLGENTRAGFNLHADCPPGKRAIGGGGHATATDFIIGSSYPVDPDTWRVGYRHVANGGPFRQGVAYVVCAPERLPG